MPTGLVFAQHRSPNHTGYDCALNPLSESDDRFIGVGTDVRVRVLHKFRPQFGRKRFFVVQCALGYRHPLPVDQNVVAGRGSELCQSPLGWSAVPRLAGTFSSRIQLLVRRTEFLRHVVMVARLEVVDSVHMTPEPLVGLVVALMFVVLVSRLEYYDFVLVTMLTPRRCRYSGEQSGEQKCNYYKPFHCGLPSSLDFVQTPGFLYTLFTSTMQAEAIL